ncbi:MAG: type II secretion system secretin GspD [Rhodospirillaceae bacterium]|nr:type II secretion system secretin GspD [Rhodospirillaceae bacterium]
MDVTIPRAFFLPVLAMALCACVANRSTVRPGISVGQPAQAVSGPPETVIGSGGVEPSQTTAREERGDIIEPGTGAFVRPGTEAAPVFRNPGPYSLGFDGVDIGEFIQVVLGDLVGANYVVDPAVAGRVTLFTPEPVESERLLPLFEQVLSMNGAVLVHSDGLYRVMATTNARLNEGIPAIVRSAGASGLSTQVIPLEFIAATEMVAILESMVADPSTVRADTARNLLLATGTRPELQTILDAVEIFDVDWLRGMSVGLFPLEHVSPGDVAEELGDVLEGLAGEAEGGDLGGLVRVVPMERLTSLLVVGSTQAALREAETWLRRLDRPGESAGRQLFVYPVQNATATELARILGTIFQEGPPQTQTGTAASGLAPGLTAVQIGAGAGVSAGGGLALSAGGAIEVIADDIRNALVVLASPQDYQIVVSAIRRLDTVPLQVLIEASILEVSLRDKLSFGVEWFFDNTLNNGENPATGVFDGGSSGIGPLSPGFAYTIVDNADQVRFALNALATESEVNVLSAPSLMVLDNQEATINVGDEIPVPTRQSTSNLDPAAPTVNEIDFRQTGVTLTVRPRVNDSGLVTMDIRQEVATAAATTTSNLDAPTIQNRLIESVVAVNSGDTVVLGGLMQDQATASAGGVPLMRRIPLFGRLFSQTNDETLRTELVVLLTPRVVRNREDARQITDEFREKMRELTPRGSVSPPASSSTPTS